MDNRLDYRVAPSPLRDARVTVPGDKSISHRALMLASLATGNSTIKGFLAGEDCLATLAACQEMGVAVSRHADTELTINGVGLWGLTKPSGPLDLGNSGTAMRIMAGLLAGQSFSSKLIGDASLSSRPMNRIIAPLQQMGASIGSDNGTPPLTIRGGRELQSIDYDMPVASAQVKSAVLMAGLYASGTTHVTEPAITRDHTERMLRTMGADVVSSAGKISLRGQPMLLAQDIRIPGDLSSATFIMLAAILAKRADVVIESVGVNPTRTGVIDILQAMGADISLENKRQFGEEPVADIHARSSSLRGIAVEPWQVSLAIDEFPALFVAAGAAAGTTTFTGIEELRVKESDRIAAMAAGLRALGVAVDEMPDGAIVHGGRYRGGCVDSFGDHRIAMSFAVAGTVADDRVIVKDIASVDTSFPGFVDSLISLGADVVERANGVSMKKVPVIAIDGPSGSGKGTIARRVADALGWHLLDSGALYRLVALAATRHGVRFDDEDGLAEIARDLDVYFGSDDRGNEQILLGDNDVTSDIRTEQAGAGASAVAALTAVREALLDLQRRFRKGPGLVADGRDMGTHVFADASVKVFLTASAEERARRRHKQLKDKGIDVSLAALSRDIEDRDRRDTERSVAPLRPAEDARLLDSSGRSIEAVVKTVLDWAQDV